VIAIKVENRLMKYIVEKGFIAIDGMSLTVSKVIGDSFEVSIIPHTFSVTNLSLRKVRDYVNLEVDITAKYIENIIMNRTKLLDE
jgi:riboflavin synthase